MSQDKPYKYDVFISYVSEDKEWVRKALIPILKETNLTFCLEDTDFEVGEPSHNQIEDAIKHSEYTIIILTPDYVRDNWSSFERMLVSSIDPISRQKRIIPIILQDCALPLRMRSLVTLDLTDKEKQASQFNRFLKLFTKKKETIFSDDKKYDFEYNLIKLNNLCKNAFDDREIIDFSYDHFFKIYENFSLKMTKEA